MSSLIPFSFESHSVRAFNIDGNPWFVAKDVALALDYSESSNPARLFSSVPDEWKGVNPIHTLGGIQEVLCLSEPGLYFFLNRSDKLNALPFQKWLAGEVLPSIRKTGGYQIPDTAHDLPVIESSLVLDFQGVPIRFLIALAATKSSGYDDDQVLNTPHVAVPRVDIAVFLCPIGFAPMGEWLVRKAGRTSTCVCSNSPTNALNSVESLKKERSYV